MKGIFFTKPIEYNIKILGESWTQGSLIKGTLTIKNHSTGPIDLESSGVNLCNANIRKIKNKDLSGFSLLESILLEESVDASSSKVLPFDFQLTEDCPITESQSSLYIVCGTMESPFDGGLLELNIIPKKAITDFIEVFENFYRFKFKGLKNKKDFIEAKITPPNAKEWTTIQAMTLRIKIESEQMILEFTFKLKKLAFDLSSTSTKDSKLIIKKILEKKEYCAFGDSPNRPGMQKVISEVLSEVRLKPVI